MGNITDDQDDSDTIQGSRVEILETSTKATLRQWSAGIIASLGMWTLGSALGWSSPSVPQLEDGDHIDGLTKDEISWVASIIMLAALPGCFIGGYLVDKIGRKMSLLSMTIPCLCGWALVAAGKTAWMLILGRVIIGITTGTFTVAAAVYIAETAEDRLRSQIVAWNVVALCLGILYTFIIGALVSWRVNTIISGATPILIFAGMLIMPESPRYLVTKGNRKKACEALKWLRGANTEQDVIPELEKLIVDVAASSGNNDITEEPTEDKIWVASTVKPVLISLSCAAFCQLSGTSAVTFYTVDIFEAAGSDIEPNISGILYATTQAVMTAFAGLLMTKFGRRPLFIFSELGMGASLAVLGVFYYLKETEAEGVDKLGWLPLASLVGFTVAYCCGAGILPWALMVDLCPPHVKGIASALVTATNCGLGFLVALLFPRLLDGIKGYGAFWMFSGINVVGAVYMFFVLPETKDKTMEEIMNLFKKPVATHV